MAHSSFFSSSISDVPPSHPCSLSLHLPRMEGETQLVERNFVDRQPPFESSMIGKKGPPVQTHRTVRTSRSRPVNAIATTPIFPYRDETPRPHQSWSSRHDLLRVSRDRANIPFVDVQRLRASSAPSHGTGFYSHYTPTGKWHRRLSRSAYFVDTSNDPTLTAEPVLYASQ